MERPEFFISRNGGWLISLPTAKYLRIEAPNESELPDRLFDLSYELKPMGTKTRIATGRFMPVRVYAFQIPLGK
jgi:hypothetical protein